MATFAPDASKPIVWNWINSDLEICPHEIQSAIEHEQDCEKTDLSLGFGSTAIGVLSTALMLGLAGVSFGMVPPIALAVAGAFHGYNAGIQGRRRELESEFLDENPSVLKAIESKLNQGEGNSKVASAYEAVFRAYRRGDDAAIAKGLEATQSQSGLQPSEDQGNARTQDEPLAVTELQSIAAAPSMSHITSPVWNPAEDLGNNPQSALIVGVPGSGKGMLVSNAIRTLKAKYPELKIFVIDPKADPKERGYWEGLADHYKAFSLMKCSDPDEGAEWLLDCMAQFTAMSGPKLCIFDELMSASTELSLANKELKALPRLKKFVVGLIGQGDSQGAWLWAMTQSPQVADMGMSGGVRANLRAIGLVSPKNLAAVEAMTSTKLIPPPPGGMDELRQIMEASPVNRAVFDGKLARWLPMPKLENHSGFDRDSRTITREVTPIAPAIVATMDPIARLENAYQAPAVEVQIQAVVSTRPDGLDEYPLIGAVWEYLLGKEPRSLKTTADAIRKSGRISMDLLEVKIPHVESFTDGIRQVLDYGIYKGFIVKVSEDAYQAAEKH